MALLLTGVPNYYHRFDYVPVLELTELFWTARRQRAKPADDRSGTHGHSGRTLRPCWRSTNASSSSFIGGSARTLAAQHYRLLSRPLSKGRASARGRRRRHAHRLPDSAVLLGLVGVEASADDWPTAAPCCALPQRLLACERGCR
ncbi:MAG: hypothetical protein R2854_19345 [Caldilineaceae bacterium]